MSDPRNENSLLVDTLNYLILSFLPLDAEQAFYYNAVTFEVLLME